MGLADEGGVLLDEGDFAEVVVPHADVVAGASVAGVAIAVGEAELLVERSGDVGGEEPFAATASRGKRGDGLHVGYPATAAVIAIEEPGGLVVGGTEAFAHDLTSESGIDGVAGEEILEIGGDTGVDG